MGQKKRKKLWSAEKMFETVLIAAPMSEAEKSEYCRKQGIYPVQLNEWKEDCIAGCRNAPDKKYIKAAKEKEKKYKKKTMALEKDLRRKEKALAQNQVFTGCCMKKASSSIEEKVKAVGGTSQKDLLQQALIKCGHGT